MNALIKLFKEITNKITSNHLLNGILSYTTWKLLETNQANRVLSNTMMAFAIVAFVLYLLEKIFGITTPLMRVGKIFKVFRNSDVLSNPKLLEDKIDYTYSEGEKIYLKLKGMKSMKKLLEWLNLNKVTITGFILFVGYSLDEVLHFTDKWTLTDEWYYAVLAIVFLFISWSIKGRGIEKLDFVDSFIKLYQEYKDNKAMIKAQNNKEKLRKKYGPIVDALKETPSEVKKEDNPQPPQSGIRLR